MKLPRMPVLEIEKFDLTPMIDIVLLLIIFFTFTASFASVSRSPMDLPQERGGEAVAASTKVFIDLARDGTMKLLDTPVTSESLKAALQAETARPGGVGEVIVRADRLTPALHLNRLAGLLAGVGVRRWQLAASGDGPGPAAPQGGTR
jgi:biopolymer transport protein ExbD